MTNTTLTVRNKNKLMASPAQLVYVCLSWLVTLAMVHTWVSILLLLFEHPWTQAIQAGLLFFLTLQFCGPMLISTLPLFLHYKRMTTANYHAVDRCNRRIIQIWPKFFLFNSGTLNVIKANWGLNRIWLGDHETGEAALRDAVRTVEAHSQARHSYCNQVLYNNLAYAILKNNGT